MARWLHPRSMQEANGRRAILIEKIADLHAEIRLRKAGVEQGDATPEEQKVYPLWRAEMFNQLQACQSELSSINAWITRMGKVEHVLKQNPFSTKRILRLVDELRAEGDDAMVERIMACRNPDAREAK